jgi:phenylacetate-CoA ligase
MADEASAMGLDPAASSIRLLILAGEPGANIASVRSRLETAWGARVIDHAGMTEIGAWGFECAEAPGGLHVIESEFIAEVVDPATGRLVSEGSLGELVLTNLGRWASPLIRYRTGDQVRVMRGPCACGRWFARCEGGVLGRVDDMLIIRGNNVFPSAVEAVVREFEEVAEFRWTVQESRAMTELYLEIEPSAKAPSAGLADRIASALRDRLHFRPNVSLVAPGSLPRFEMKARRFQRSSAP